MQVALSEDFMEALSKLNGNEIKKASKTIMSIKKESDTNGLRAHKINHPCGSIVSYSVNMDIRIIAFQKDKCITFLYIDHHDDAYHWVENRNFFCAPNNDIRIVMTTESTIPMAYEAIKPYSKRKTIVNDITVDMVEKLREMESDDELFAYINEQPEEIQEKLFDIALNALRAKSCKISHSFEIKVINDDSVLEEALKYPLQRWRIFLHPRQEMVIASPLNESVLLTGAPGTGKTVCLVHKANKMASQIGAGECILISTFKVALKDYLLEMLSALSYDKEKIFIVDISLLNQLGDNLITENLDGFFRWQNKHLFYYRKKCKYEVKHILFDEYQDFTKSILSTILNMTSIVPFTISYDYSQSIYKQINRTADSFKDNEIKKYILYYSYRVNTRILMKLKRLMRLISIMSNEDLISVGMTEEEKNIIQNTESAIEGSDIRLLPYKDEKEKSKILEEEYQIYRNAYKTDEIIVTTFIPDFFCNLQNEANFRCEDVPASTRISYSYLPTLKGKEYKAGIIVLDDIICQLLNTNRILFDRIDGALKGQKKNTRFYLNLLYVALSRFRDFITVLYPIEYKETISPIFE